MITVVKMVHMCILCVYAVGALESCILTGTTGMAATTLWQNTTISVAAIRQIDNTTRNAALQRLQLYISNKHHLIIDEMSMLGQHMLTWEDRRLKQATTNLDQPLV